MSDGSNGSGGIGVRTQVGLHQLVGYAELIKAAGVSRSTIERAWRGPWDDGEPHLPKPGKIGSRSVWTAEDANSWLLTRARWQCGLMANMARLDVDDLAPEHLAEAAVDLLTRAVEHELGEPIDPRGLRVTYAPPSPEVTEEQLAGAEAREVDLLHQRFAGLDITRSTIMAAWLFLELREVFAAWTADPRASRAFLDPHKLRALALQALSDDAWAAAEAELG